MAENGKGEDISVSTQWTGGIVDKTWFTDKKYEKYRQPGNVKVPFWLNPVKSYVGPAWYQRDITIPLAWPGNRIILFLERCHWETRVWMDSQEVGMRNSLAAPHEYDLTRYATTGRHRLTLRVDNRIKEIDVGRNAHSVSDHTQTNWNGVVGKIELRLRPPVNIAQVRLFPDIHTHQVKVQIDLDNQTGLPRSGEITMSAAGIGAGKSTTLVDKSLRFDIRGPDTTLEMVYPMGENVRLWDEFVPNLYRMTISARLDRAPAADTRVVQFGMRDFAVSGTQFSVNGRPVFLRGTLECAIFPKTGYASTSAGEWERIFRICKSFGLNHVRFHSWCPPEAAFDAADRAGIYLYVECCAWTTVGDGKPIDRWLYEESNRIVTSYGNHPSFCMMSYGNEPSGENQKRFLGEFVKYWKQKDPRRLYTSAAGWPQIPENDFHITDAPRIQLWGAGLKSIINSQPPQTAFDFRDIISKYPKPVVSHEIGQWCVYPDFAETKKYAGVLRAKNFEMFKESLDDHHMGDQARDFLTASGNLQVLCYKADIEAALRTPGMAGFELLDLHDFPGQGTALVGVLNPFWEEKGYVTAKEYSRFCNSTVPLVRLKKRIFLDTDVLSAAVEVSHFGRAALKAATPVWQLKDDKGRAVAHGSFTRTDIPLGNAFSLGTIQVPLSGIRTARKLNLEVSVGRFANDWDLWVYPSHISDSEREHILVATALDAEVVKSLEAGGKVLLLADTNRVKSNVPPGFSSIFWNTAWTSGQPPHTLGILCNPKHPALRGFPTESHSNWQWWDLITHSRAMILDSLPSSIHPLVQVIDDWVTNRRLGLVFEAKVGKGSLLVCSIDLTHDLENRPVARQLLLSLKRYVQGPQFSPRYSVGLEALQTVFNADPAFQGKGN